MQDNLPCKKITSDKPEGRRRAGRPILRWMDGVTRVAEKLGVRNWRIKTRDRDGWRRILESAKTLRGL
jgi:1-acyl-sn-glycerol-3-phosphate acyltransferase